MADRKRMTTATIDPVARAKFEEEMKRQRGMPARRPAIAPVGRQPSVWMNVMSTLDNLFANMGRSLMGGRLTGSASADTYGNVGSGYGGRERAAQIDKAVSDMQK